MPETQTVSFFHSVVRSPLTYRLLALLTMAFSLIVGTFVYRLEGPSGFNWQFNIGGEALDTSSFGVRVLPRRAGDGQSESRPTLMHEPLYPLWLTAHIRGSPIGPYLLVISQAILHTLATLLVFSAAQWILPPGSALAAGLLTGLDPLLLSVIGRPYEENLSVFLLAVSLWFLIRIHPPVRKHQAGILGVCLGVLYLSRFQGLGLFLFLAVYLAIVSSGLGDAPRRVSVKRASTVVLILALGWSLPVLPWAYRNWVDFGTVRLAPSRLMWTLCQKAAVLKGDFGARDVLAYSASLYSAELAERLFEGVDPHRDQRSTVYCDDLRAKLLGEGKNEVEIEDALRRFTLELVADKPVQYVGIVLATFLSLPAFELDAAVIPRDPLRASRAHTALGILRAGLRVYGLVLLGLVVVGAVRALRAGNGRAILIGLLLVVYVAPHGVTRFHGYFFITILPLVALLAVCGLGLPPRPLPPMAVSKHSGTGP